MLTLLAAAICAGCVVSAMKTLQVSLTSSNREGWRLLASGTLATGIWSAHVVAMLACSSTVSGSYSPSTTILAIVIVSLVTWSGFTLSDRASGRAEWAAVGGAIVGAGLAAMHFVGAPAMKISGTVIWNNQIGAAAVVCAVVLAAASLRSFYQMPGPRGFWIACALLFGAAASMHSIALEAQAIIPDGVVTTSAAGPDRVLLALGVAAMSLLSMGAGIAAVVVEQIRGRVQSEVVKLQAQVEERRRAQAEVERSEARLIVHQATIADLMTKEGFRSGSLEEATRHLMRALASGLGVERAGFLLLDRDKNALIGKEVYVVAEDKFVVPEGYGDARHLAALKRSSARQVMAVDDTSVENGLEEFRELFFEKHRIKAVLHAPIVANGDLVGFLTCTNITHRVAWTAEQRVFALSIANLAAVVVERHQRLALEAAATTSARRLTAQHELLNSLIVSDRLLRGEIGELLSEVTKVLCREMQVDRVSVRFFANSGIEAVHTEVLLAEEDRIVAVERDPKRHYPNRFAVAIVSGPLVVGDCALDPLTASQYETRLRPRRIRAMLHAPIRSENKLVGVIACSMYDAPRDWSAEDVLLATSLANVFALARERRLRLETEESLRKANVAAEEANRAKSLFLANMSHEIRTPMNGVLGMADLLSRSGLNERQRRIAGTITDSAHSLLAIINDILDISRIEGGKLPLDAVDFDLSHCVEEAVELLVPQAHKKSLDLNLFVDDDVRGTVTGDPVRLRQVLVNLIGNAIKFTQEGEVSVLVLPDKDHGGQGVRFIVRDTGIGILPDLQVKLFQPFTQADTSITRRFGGTGLGLSISRHLVEMMGGRIGLESAPGQGALIWVVLPFAVRQSLPSIGNDRTSLAGRRVLVVDDRATNREIVTSYMASSGALVEAVGDAAAAMSSLEAAMVAKRPFDLAIIDFIMEGCDGLELARRITATPDLQGVKMILLSSIAWSPEIGDYAAAGIERVLHKPIRRDEIVAIAVDCLARDRGAARPDDAESDAVPEIRPLGLRVLVAEDNPVNQIVAEEYLLSLGCSVTIAENGVQALAEIDRGAFDVVLMDCQMPEMDGYTATRQIRAREKAGGYAHLPILAVTANAYEADRKLCIDAGMDSYLSKPYSQSQLAEAVLGVTMSATSAGAAPGAEQAVREEPPTNAPRDPAPAVLETAAAKPGESIRPVRPKLRDKLLRTYLGFAPKPLDSLAAALQAEDASAIALLAHSLKSGSANVGLDEIAQLCTALEAAGRAGDIPTCRSLVPRILKLNDDVAASQASESMAGVG
jgi:signal transduction histidine kinase/DNA-binding response OmpR family regulator/NO-binding membrane sensor protein with MHYT domain/HPt (histidine-containing phosphotransfer) domain-containing protein